MKSLLILGAGGHGISVAELATSVKRWDTIYFADDIYPNIRSTMGIPIISRLDDVFGCIDGLTELIVAIGNNRVRANYIKLIQKHAAPLATLVHPTSWISPSAQIGAGTTIMPGAAVGSQSKIGIGCILNMNCSVDHQVTLENFVHLGINVGIAGGCRVGESSWLHAGTALSYGTRVSSNQIIHSKTISTGLD